MVYLPPHFAELDIDAIHALIRRHPLATIVTLGPDGMSANAVPLLVDPMKGANGSLIGHVARANDCWREGYHQGETLVIFQGAEAYITPNWYATEQETHEVVPTWNYQVVHAYGELVIHDDPKWVRGVVGRLTKAMETTQHLPWKMADAPPAFTTSQLNHIVGIELPIGRLIGKTKASQNRSRADRDGVIDGLEAAGEEKMAAVVRSAGEKQSLS